MFKGWNRLSEELSPEDEGDQCRICHSVRASPDNPLLSPCLCVGSLRFVHSRCLKKWIQMKIKSGQSRTVTNICELCKGELNVDPMMFRQKDKSPAKLQDKAETQRQQRRARRAKILICLETACKMIVLLTAVLVMMLS